MNMWRIAVDQARGRRDGEPTRCYDRRPGVGEPGQNLQGRNEAGVSLACRLDQSGRDSVRSGNDPHRAADGSRRIE